MVRPFPQRKVSDVLMSLAACLIDLALAAAAAVGSEQKFRARSLATSQVKALPKIRWRALWMF
jgi:hypothetical protein